MTAQAMEALTYANEVRQLRAEIKRQVREGETTVSEVLTHRSRDVTTMRIGELIRCRPYWGRGKTTRLLQFLRLSENKPIGTMTDRQTDLLIDTLGER